MYTIYISTFGKKVLRVPNGVPIEVGALNRKNFVYDLHDDTGENISSLNEYYGELSGLYWVWKNVKIDDGDIIGFCHYNKCLNISKKKAKKWLKKEPQGFIALNPIYAKRHDAKDEIEAIERVLSSNIDDYRSWELLYDENGISKYRNCYSCNMFITTGKSFDQFCTWLFNILMNLRTIVGDKPEVEPNLRRYCAFIGERLLSVYVKSRGIPVYCVDKRIKEWWLPIFYPIVRAIGMNRDSRFYHLLSKKFGSSSSYRLVL